MQELLALAERRGYRVFILGARDDVLARALVRIHERHPALVVAGARDGYFSDEDAAAVAGRGRGAPARHRVRRDAVAAQGVLAGPSTAGGSERRS